MLKGLQIIKVKDSSGLGKSRYSRHTKTINKRIKEMVIRNG